MMRLLLPKNSKIKLILIILATAASVMIHRTAEAQEAPDAQEAQASKTRPKGVISALERKYEAILQHVITNAGKDSDLKQEYFDVVLDLYYKMMDRQENFYQTNLDTIEKRKQDPSYEMPIAEIPSYVQLRALWPLSDELEEKIVYIYGRLHEIAHDTASPQKAAAISLIGSIHQWIENRDESDRLLLSSILNRLAEIKRKFDSASNVKKGDRSIASIEKFDMDKFSFDGRADLSNEFKKHDAEFLARGKAAMKNKNPAFDEAIASAFVVTEEREPANTALVFKPSVGSDGSFSGVAMPAGDFVQTFDDGPNPTLTDKLIDLASTFRTPANPNGVPLTFFWLANNTVHYPKQIARAKSMNYLANNHSWTHPVFHSLSAAQLHHEIADADVQVTKDFGVQPVIGTSKIPFFRCPYGDCIYANHNHGVPVARQLIAAQGEIHILWNIDSNDWAAINRHNPARTAQLTIAQMKAQRRGVILNHDIQPHTPEAFQIVLDWVKSQNAAGQKIRYVSVKDAIANANKAAGSK